jgi:thiamine-monophosphate kinase
MPIRDEFELIKNLNQILGRPSKKVKVGIGDDAAVVEPPKGKLVSTVDSMVEGVHFDLMYTTPRELGHKSLAVNLSDIAAMGAKPLFALISLGLSQECSDEFVYEVYEGIKLLAKKYKVDIIGGNVSQSPSAITIDITLLGEVNEPILRSGAIEGDLIAVTGILGDSAAGLNGIRRLGRPEMENYPELLKAHLRPEPRLHASELISKIKASSLIDISDGLSREVHAIADASQVGMLIDETQIPLSKSALKLAKIIHSQPLGWALFGGEDYELLFTFPAKNLKKAETLFRGKKEKMTVIGEVKNKSFGVKIKKASGEIEHLQSLGWNHFVKRRKIP